MDFVDFCGLVLDSLIKLSRSSTDTRLTGVDSPSLAKAMFGGKIGTESDYWNSEYSEGIESALLEMKRIGFIEHPHSDQFRYAITRKGQGFVADVIPWWESICQTELDSDQQHLLRTLNKMSERLADDHAWLEEIHTDKLMSELGWTDRHFFVSVIEELERDGFANCPGIVGNLATYLGLVWDTRRGFTLESRFIDSLVDEWETTSVDFKRELRIDTADQKAEFIKDVIGLGNTQSSGRRWMIIGFDDKTRSYYGPPDHRLSQNRFEQILAQCTAPMVYIKYEVVDYRSGPVGKLEILRDRSKLPYTVAKSIGDKKRVFEGQIFVRHGSQTEEPTPAELQAIRDEVERPKTKL